MDEIDKDYARFNEAIKTLIASASCWGNPVQRHHKSGWMVTGRFDTAREAKAVKEACLFLGLECSHYGKIVTVCGTGLTQGSVAIVRILQETGMELEKLEALYFLPSSAPKPKHGVER